MLLYYNFVPALQERHALPVTTFMQDSAPLYIAREVETFFLESFTENRVTSRGYKIQWPSRSPVDHQKLLVMEILKVPSVRDLPNKLVELKSAIRLTVTAINDDMLHAAVMGAVTRLACLLACCVGNVEHLQI